MGQLYGNGFAQQSPGRGFGREVAREVAFERAVEVPRFGARQDCIARGEHQRACFVADAATGAQRVATGPGQGWHQCGERTRAAGSAVAAPAQVRAVVVKGLHHESVAVQPRGAQHRARGSLQREFGGGCVAEHALCECAVAEQDHEARIERRRWPRHAAFARQVGKQLRQQLVRGHALLLGNGRDRGGCRGAIRGEGEQGLAHVGKAWHCGGAAQVGQHGVLGDGGATACARIGITAPPLSREFGPRSTNGGARFVEQVAQPRAVAVGEPGRHEFTLGLAETQQCCWQCCHASDGHVQPPRCRWRRVRK